MEEVYNELNKDIIALDHDFKNRIKQTNLALNRESEKYRTLIAKIRNKDQEIVKDEESIKHLKDGEGLVHENLKELEKAATKIGKIIEQKNDKILHDIRDVNILKEEIKLLRTEMLSERKNMNSLTKEKLAKEKEIEETVKAIAKKIVSKNKNIKEGMTDAKKIQADFVNFLSKKKNIKEMLTETDKDTMALEVEMEKLITETKRLNTLSKSSNIKSYSKEIKKAYDDMKSKHGKVHKDYNTLSNMLKPIKR